MAKAYLEIEDIDKLEAVAKYNVEKLLVRLLFRSAARVSEVVALEVPNIDFDKGTITILHLKQRIALTCPACSSRLGRGHVFCPKCGAKITEAVARKQEDRKVRTIPLDQDTLDILKYYVETGGPIEKNGKNLIFGFHRNRAYQIIRDLAMKAGLPDLVNPDTGDLRHVSPHRLRDAFATQAMKIDDSGDGQRKLQEYLGHQNFNTTAKYRKISGEEQKEWYDNILKGIKDNHNGDNSEPAA